MRETDQVIARTDQLQSQLSATVYVRTIVWRLQLADKIAVSVKYVEVR